MEPSSFPSTLWSEVMAAGAGSRGALETLAERYYGSVYRFIRARQNKEEDARDMTQDFFTYVLEGHVLPQADPDRGRFRWYLKACLRNFLANQSDRQQALKRGGGKRILSLDIEGPERAHRPGDDPERAFDHQWALDVMQRALTRLRECVQPKSWQAFEAVQRGEAPSLQDVSAALGMSDDAVAQALHRAREKLRELVLRELCDTLVSPEHAEAELSDLMRAMSQRPV